MATEVGDAIILRLYESRDIIPMRIAAGNVLISRPPDIYTRPLSVGGNSLISSIFVYDLDPGATVTARWYDTTTGSANGEKYPLGQHPVISAAGITSRQIIPGIHDKPFVEVEVLGGSATFGVYVTVVSSASDLDSALQLDGNIADLVTDKGMPSMYFDESDGQFHFIRGENGSMSVVLSEEGSTLLHTALGSTGLTASTPGIVQKLVDETVPVGKEWLLNRTRLAFRGHGSYEIVANGAIICSGRLGPSSVQDDYIYAPREAIAAGTKLEINFCAHSSTPALPVEAYARISEVDI